MSKPAPAYRFGRWFRFYESAASEPKIMKLTDANFRAWVIILCLASKDGGLIPPIDDIAIMLHLSEKDASKRVEALIAAGLIENTERGLVPHNWNARQFQSDVSTTRVQRFRERHRGEERNVSETADETFRGRS